ncbi:pro-sigmaK processing inhibitor BofA family protein [Proteinivorax tanatarense]|uniref:Pro-sigmaK processing inhibitor BofA family protein n=1 Tax=Proteinivorax tanatarense TaxID=1260629 RepID=A0AAU7VLJ6_9FIRM
MNANYEILFISILALFAAALLLRPMIKRGKTILKLVLFSGMGLCLLIFLNIFGNYFNMYLPLNYFTILTSLALGCPGVVMLGVLKIIFV